VTPQLAVPASPGQSASSSPSSAIASASPLANGSASPSPTPVDPNAPVRFAVDLFDVDESTIAPGSAATIEALGLAPSTPPGPSGGASGGTGSATERPTARDELWVPIVMIVLVVLCLEWAVYQRDAVVRLRRGLAARLGRQPVDRSA
jgi:hypothetical protein